MASAKWQTQLPAPMRDVVKQFKELQLAEGEEAFQYLSKRYVTYVIGLEELHDYYAKEGKPEECLTILKLLIELALIAEKKLQTGAVPREILYPEETPPSDAVKPKGDGDVRKKSDAELEELAEMGKKK